VHVAGYRDQLTKEKMHILFESIGDNKLIDLRDKAIRFSWGIGVMAYTFARVSAACRLRVSDYLDLGRQTFIRVQEKGGVEREIPCHPNLTQYLDDCIRESGVSGDDPLCPSFTGADHGQIGSEALGRDECLQMVKRRLKRAGLPPLFSNHSFRATGITTFLENGGQLETAQRIAGHADSRTTKGYDRRATRLELSEIVRIQF
jgi:integrase/recombinase XerD